MEPEWISVGIIFLTFAVQTVIFWHHKASQHTIAKALQKLSSNKRLHDTSSVYQL